MASPSSSPTTPPDVLLPEGIALMPRWRAAPTARPAIAYYDRTRGNLRYVEYVPSTKSGTMPVILDGEDAMGNDTGDVGMYPSLAFDDDERGAHLVRERDAATTCSTSTSMTKMPEVVDDGYRPKDEMTLDGLASPVYHLVGDSSSIQLRRQAGHRLPGLDGGDSCGSAIKDA